MSNDENFMEKLNILKTCIYIDKNYKNLMIGIKTNTVITGIDNYTLSIVSLYIDFIILHVCSKDLHQGTKKYTFHKRHLKKPLISVIIQFFNKLKNNDWFYQ